jgi:hypothetical protein
MRHHNGFLLACMLFASCAGWSQSSSDTESVRKIILRFCQLDAEGALLESGSSAEVHKYISNDVVLQGFPIIVIKKFSVDYLKVTDDTATVVVDYEFFGDLDDRLVYKPIVDLHTKKIAQPLTGDLQVRFKLKRKGTGTRGWVISSCGSGSRVNIDKAILYLKKEQNSGPNSTNKHNAEEAVSLLEASTHR